MENKENFVTQLQEFLESKGLTQDEAEQYLVEVFKKAFEKDRDALSKYEEEEPESANVEVKIDMTNGDVSIERFMDVVEEKTIFSRFRQIESGDERLEGTDLSIGDQYKEVILLDDLTMGKRQHIKQLFLQKLSEVEKMNIYKKFSKFKGELLNAKIHNVLSRGNLILDFNGDSIFMPANEVSPLDRDRIVEGKYLPIYVLEIEELSKDAQIIASRKNPNFVSKLIEQEIDDVSDGVVNIEAVAREAGFKTKVAVSTSVAEVDPVGSIIGVRGQKIKPIVDEIGGERLDVIKYHEDIEQFIAEALLPAEIVGIKVTESEEGWREAIVIVEQDQFLPALGKRGLNIKLAAILTKSKIDVKTVAEAKEDGIEYKEITKSKFVSKNNSDFIGNMDLDEFGTIEDIAEQQDDSMFSDEDYDMSEQFDNQLNDDLSNTEEEELYDPEFDDEEFGQ